MFGKAFKSRPNYVFDYKPRYYDERKERLEKLKKKYQNNKTDSNDFKSTLIQSNLKSNWQRNKHIAHDKKANIRLAIIISILVGLFSYILELHKLF